MRASVARRPAPDPTVYPEEERVGEDILQRWIVELLRPLLQAWLTRRGVKALVGADQFIYWRQHDAHARVAPDLYVLPGVDPRTRVRTWKVWQTRVVPSVALEVVSEAWEKDYGDVLRRYEELGVPEVLVFDPGCDEHPGGVRWQVFRRVGRRGLVRVESTDADRVRSKQLGCWFRAIGDGRDTRVRIAVGPRGDEVVPTVEEVERAAKEAERAGKEAERAAKEAALARVSALEAELRRLKARQRRG
jgi:Uma2 family endonuclease